MAGLRNHAERMSYVIGKHGCRLVTESLANDLRQAGASHVSAHVLCPMGTRTNFGKNMVNTGDYAGLPGIRDVTERMGTALETAGQTPTDLAEHMISSCLAAGKD